MNLAVRHASGGTPAPVGRARLISSVTAKALDGQAVAVHGPTGMGRTTFLEVVSAGLPQVITVRLHGHCHPGQGAADVAAAFPRETLAELPDRMRAVLLDPRSLPGADPAVCLGDALTELLTNQAAHTPFVLVVDDVQHLDRLSLTALRAAASRSLGPGALGILVGVGPLEADPATGFVTNVVAAREVPVLHIDLQPVAGADMVEMLTSEGVPADTALWAHRESGGNPGLAHGIAAAVDGLAPEEAAHQLEGLVRQRAHDLSQPVRSTLRRLAAMHQPTTAALVRLGGDDAVASIRTARALGLLITEDEYLRLTPTVLGDVLLESVDSDELIVLHRDLAIDDGRGAPGVVVAVDRAAAETAAARGDLEEARRLSTRSATLAEEHRLSIEQARSLVTLAHIERRARRSGRSRQAAARAREVLRPLHAIPWTQWVRARFPEGAALHTLEPEDPDQLSALTLTEHQVAGLVADGASNWEIAQRLHLSVKTVEGTLTRIYRKTGLRSRTQLAALVLGHGPR